MRKSIIVDAVLVLLFSVLVMLVCLRVDYEHARTPYMLTVSLVFTAAGIVMAMLRKGYFRLERKVLEPACYLVWFIFFIAAVFSTWQWTYTKTGMFPAMAGIWVIISGFLFLFAYWIAWHLISRRQTRIAILRRLNICE